VGSSNPAGAKQVPLRTTGNGRARAALKLAAEPILSSEESAVLRDRLLSEVASLQSHENATNWAKQALAFKNKLITHDAATLEEAFAKRLTEFSLEGEGALTDSGPDQTPSPPNEPSSELPTGIDKSVLTVPEPRRRRDREHIRFVSLQPCLLCGRKPSDPHHLKFTQPRALGRKSSDEFTVPLCRFHHHAVHRAGNEVAWWKIAGIDPIKVARKYWKETRGSAAKERPKPQPRIDPADQKTVPDPITSASGEPRVGGRCRDSFRPGACEIAKRTQF
jgi:hypothetical protein